MPDVFISKILGLLEFLKNVLKANLSPNLVETLVYLKLNILAIDLADKLCLVSINSEKRLSSLKPGKILKIPPPPLFIIIILKLAGICLFHKALTS